MTYFTHAGAKSGKSKNDQKQLKLQKGHCNSSQCSLKMVTVQ